MCPAMSDGRRSRGDAKLLPQLLHEALRDLPVRELLVRDVAEGVDGVEPVLVDDLLPSALRFAKHKGCRFCRKLAANFSTFSQT